jgi:hypothetical protein
MKKIIEALTVALFLALLVGSLDGQQIFDRYTAGSRQLPTTCSHYPVKMAGSPNGTLGFIGICDGGSQTLFILFAGAGQQWVKVGTMADFDPNGTFKTSGTSYSGSPQGELYVTDDAVFLSVISPTDKLNLSGWKVSLPDLIKTFVISRGNLPGWNGSFKYFGGPKPGYAGPLPAKLAV